VSGKGQGRAARSERRSGTKVCGKCKERKQLTEFSRDRSRRDGLLGACRACDNARRAAHRASFEAPRRPRRRLAVIAWLGERCVVCRESDAAQLQFDHIDPRTKRTTVSALLDTGTWVRILEEAAKCQLLCVECHKEKTRAEAYIRKIERWVEEDEADALAGGLYESPFWLYPSASRPAENA
jgi:hypothetical protein